ncbi:hypothetical protein [Mycoplasmopsis glycophila]|uniref:Lipoprotein n=1 Tax=Mycoplasmopsis glycophila TaxID=171285 RepID=A0A449AVY5_9BACT|nr:hypothetical protein [Mycoplasmopsis glycophila]VEU70796.1 Uncharacterised protein [Mycoplasmopsis glycophila]
MKKQINLWKAFAFSSSLIAPLAISSSCNAVANNNSQNIFVKTLLDKKQEAWYIPQTNLTFSELEKELGKKNAIHSADYERLLKNATQIILDNLNKINLQPKEFYIFPENNAYSFSDTFKEQLGLSSNNSNNNSSNHAHKHYKVDTQSFKLLQLNITNDRVYDSNEINGAKVWFVARGNVVFKFLIVNNQIYFSNQILMLRFAKNTKLNSNLQQEFGYQDELDLINKFFNPTEINQELVNEYEKFALNEVLGPVALIRLQN